MSDEWFSRLKEYDSLSKARARLILSGKDQEGRLETLRKRQADSMAQLAGLKSSYIHLQQSLHEIEQKIKVQNEQRSRSIDQGGSEEKLRAYNKEISSLEEKGFSFLEDLDVNETERADLQGFLNGLEKTMIEIAGEVKEETAKFQNEIEQLDLRLNSLTEALPAEYRDLLMRTLKKNLALGPFTRVENGSCFFCRANISRNEESEVEMQKILKTCSQCGRIFIPYGT